MSIKYLSLSQKGDSPAEILSNLSISCTELNIQKFDVYGDSTLSPDGSWLRKFENEVSSYFGKEEGLFLPSGIMAQEIMLMVSQQQRSLSIGSRQPTSFVCHYTSHLILHENHGYDALLKLNPIIIPPHDDEMIQQSLSYHDVAHILDSDDNKPFALVLEVPHREIGGKCTSRDDIAAMSEHCRRQNIHFHMDGARIWEASAATSYSSSNEASANAQELSSMFDSMYVSFYKGLGAVTGAMLIGSPSFIQDARIWQRRFGGNLYSLLPYGVSCWTKFRSIDKNDFFARRNALALVVKRLTETYIDSNQKPLIRFDPPVPEVSVIHIYLNADMASCNLARDKAIEEVGISCFTRIRECSIGATRGQCYLELNMGPTNMQIDVEDWIKGWGTCLQYLQFLISVSESNA